MLVYLTQIVTSENHVRMVQRALTRAVATSAVVHRDSVAKIARSVYYVLFKARLLKLKQKRKPKKLIGRILVKHGVYGRQT